MAKKSNFKDIFNRYKTYNPAVEGYGSAHSWRGAFNERMGLDEAKRVITDSPWCILGVAQTATWTQIRAAYKQRSRETHPDYAKMNNMTEIEATEAFKQVAAAYSVLAAKFGK